MMIGYSDLEIFGIITMMMKQNSSIYHPSSYHIIIIEIRNWMLQSDIKKKKKMTSIYSSFVMATIRLIIE